MAFQIIGVGAAPNDGTGDPNRTAFQKVNANFALFSAVATSGAYADLTGKPALAAVATSGAYADLSGTPAIPVVHPGYISGRVYSPFPRTATPSATVSHAIDTISYSPVLITKAVTISTFFIRTGSSNAVAGSANIGLYADASGQPGALLQTIATAVAIPASINSIITVTPAGGNFTLQPGMYWFGVQLSATIQMVGDGGSTFFMWMLGTTNTSGYFASTNIITAFTQAASFAGGLPNPAVPVASLAAVTSGVFKVA